MVRCFDWLRRSYFAAGWVVSRGNGRRALSLARMDTLPKMSNEALKVDPHATLWVTDAELIRRSGMPVKKARRVILALDNDCRSGFPPKVELWGDRRYWPAVQ